MEIECIHVQMVGSLIYMERYVFHVQLIAAYDPPKHRARYAHIPMF